MAHRRFKNPPCAGKTNLFFEGADNRGESIIREAEAKALCRDCPYQEPCLQMGLENEIYGIWGGATPAERRELRKARRITVKLYSIGYIVDQMKHPHCGSEQGWAWNQEQGKFCEDCETAHENYTKRRDYLLSLDDELPHPHCGTDSGYQLLAKRAWMLGGAKEGHRVKCPACRKAHSDKWRENRQQRRARGAK